MSNNISLPPNAASAIPVVVTEGDAIGGVAYPAYGYDTYPNDRGIVAATPRNVKVIRDADLVENGGAYSLAATPYAIPMFTAPSELGVATGLPIAIYPVNRWQSGFDPLVTPNLEAFYEVSEGLHVCPASAKNKIKWSENFLRFPITALNGITITPYTALDPNGEFPSASLAVPTAGGASFGYQNVTVTPLTQYTFSGYVLNAGVGAGTFRLSLYGSNTVHQTIVPSGVWQRIQVTCAITQADAVLACEVDPDISGGNNPVYIWGLQLEEGIAATAYEANGPAINTAAILMWLDQSENERHYVAGGGEPPPDYQTNFFNSYTSVKIDGDKKLDALSTFPVTTGLTWISLHEIIQGVAGTIQLNAWGEDTSFELINQADDGALYNYGIKVRKAGDLFDVITSQDVAVGKHVIVLRILDGGAISLLVDGVVNTLSQANAPTFAGSLDEAKIGSTGNLGLFHYGGEAWLSRVISDTEASNFTNYFTEKYL